MTAEVVIFRSPVHPASEVTDTYLKVIKSGNQHQNAVLGFEFTIRASLYHQLAPLAAKHGLTVGVFISRLCEVAIEAAPRPDEVRFE